MQDDQEKTTDQFRLLGLSEASLKAVAAKGFKEPTEIQRKCIPALLSGHGNLIGQAQTGTGKTAAFALPIIEMVEREGHGQIPKALVLVPTRELCIQVCDEIKSLAQSRPVRACPIYGGASYNIQLRDLKSGIDIIVGTPGRIQDHLERGTLRLDDVRVCVLDEADEMLDMGFVDDIRNILSQMPQKPQMLCFSATMPEPILKLASEFMGDYELVRTQSTEMTSNLTHQYFYELYEEDKPEALRRTIDMEKDFYGLVFCRTKLQCDEVGMRLISEGYNAEVLHGDLSQTQRELIVHRMRERRISILVATDVAARGIDIPELTHVINYSLPEDPESYIHRIGRTGRAGKEGCAVSFVTPREFRRFSFFQKIARTEVEKRRVPTIDEIIAVKRRILVSDIDALITKAEAGECPDSMYALAKLLGQSHHTTNIIAALLNDKYSRLADPSRYKEITDLYEKKVRQRREHTDRPERKERRQKSTFRKGAKAPAKGGSRKKKANTSRFKG